MVPIKAVNGLVIAMERFIELPSLAVNMGLELCHLAIDKFNLHKLNQVMRHEMGFDT